MFWCVGVSFLSIAMAVFCYPNAENKGAQAPFWNGGAWVGGPNQTRKSAHGLFESARGREVELAPTPVIGQPVVIRSPPKRGMSGIDIHYHD